MKILFIGDIVGAPGRAAIERGLYKIQDEYDIDFTVANAENATAGFGLNKNTYKVLNDIGIDAFTMGNHVWDNRDIFNFIDQVDNIVRPLNLVPQAPGVGYRIFDVGDKNKLAVINLMGQQFMPNVAEATFIDINRLVQQLNSDYEDKNLSILLDFHAEATSEKKAMGWYLDGRVSAVVGTHTHVQTNDACILPKKTAYISDVGMTGPLESVLGMDKDLVINRMINQMPVRFEPANGDLHLNAVCIDIDDLGKAKDIKLINQIYSSI